MRLYAHALGARVCAYTRMHVYHEDRYLRVCLCACAYARTVRAFMRVCCVPRTCVCACLCKRRVCASVHLCFFLMHALVIFLLFVAFVFSWVHQIHQLLCWCAASVFVPNAQPPRGEHVQHARPHRWKPGFVSERRGVRTSSRGLRRPVGRARHGRGTGAARMSRMPRILFIQQ